MNALNLTWRAALPMLLALYEDGTPDGRAFALDELKRLAFYADIANEQGSALALSSQEPGEPE